MVNLLIVNENSCNGERVVKSLEDALDALEQLAKVCEGETNEG